MSLLDAELEIPSCTHPECVATIETLECFRSSVLTLTPPHLLLSGSLRSVVLHSPGQAGGGAILCLISVHTSVSLSMSISLPVEPPSIYFPPLTFCLIYPRVFESCAHSFLLFTCRSSHTFFFLEKKSLSLSFTFFDYILILNHPFCLAVHIDR